MKKGLLFSVVMLLFAAQLLAQVPRNLVILEIATGTWCTYCPGAANGADQLVAEGKSVAVIEYHDGDVYANTASGVREAYYGVTGVPDAYFDGTLNEGGGIACPSGNMYSYYLADYNQQIAVNSPLSIDISGSNSGNVYTVVLSIKKVAAIAGTDLRAHLVLTESDIPISPPWPGSSGCMNDIKFVERAMVPDGNGTAINFSTGDMQIISLTFTKDASWNATHCKLVAFVQDHPTKTVYNGAQVALNALPAPLAVDFTGTPTSGCAPLTVNFTGTAVGATNFQWSCPGGTPSTSTVQNPTTTYTTTGTQNVTFTAWNAATGRGNTLMRQGYISSIAAPDAPAQPFGANGLCQNPPDQVYAISVVPNATSYTWDLQPPAAGVITPNNTNCTVNFDNAFTGTASLKVKAANSCGEGAYSTPLQITVSAPPGVPATPSGPAQLCMNAPNTIYTTTGATPATSYSWEILPPAAGTVSGNGTSGTVDWSPTFVGPAQIHVLAVNGGCQGSTWSNFFDINVNEGPSQYTVTGGGTFCGASGSGLPVGLSGSQTGVNYTLYLNGTATSSTVAGTGSSISFGNQTGAGTYTIVGHHALAGCDNTMNGSVAIAVDPQAPLAPTAPTGPEMVYTGSTPTTSYSTTGGQYATTYSWELSPAGAGTINGTSTTGTATWNTSYSGPAQVKVQGVNTCGGGSFSTEYTVTVEVGVGVPQLNQVPQISIFPNPAKNQVTVQSTLQGKVTIRIRNIQGLTVYETVAGSLKTGFVIDVNGFTPGIYFFDITGNDVSQVRKVVIE